MKEYLAMECQTSKKTQYMPSLGPPFGVTGENLGDNLSGTLNLHVDCEKKNEIKVRIC